ncbi:MAG: hypothetical protein ACXW08_01800 [Solirubrobacteraceae bacterium]
MPGRLDRWSVAGTITTREGSSVTANVRWRGTGTVVDGETLVDDSTDNAEMETLEDVNLSWTPGD